MQVIINITDDEQRILESWMGVGKIQSWLQHAIDNKTRKRVDACILEHTDRNPKKMSMEAKLIALSTIELPTREERDGV
jgi:hypothetical protein